MKINWGTGIVIAIVLFMSFIMYFVISMSTDKKFSHDLVTEKYYEKELAYQDQIDAEENTRQLKEGIRIVKSEKGLLIYLPKELKNKTPEEIINWALKLSDNRIVILLIINLILLFVGIFMDMTPAVLIFTPIFLAYLIGLL